MDHNITVSVNGKSIRVPPGSMASAAVAAAGVLRYRTSVSGAPRGPVCGMGVCFECRVTIDGASHQRSCHTVCRPGMEIETDEP